MRKGRASVGDAAPESLAPRQRGEGQGEGAIAFQDQPVGLGAGTGAGTGLGFPERLRWWNVYSCRPACRSPLRMALRPAELRSRMQLPNFNRGGGQQRGGCNATPLSSGPQLRLLLRKQGPFAGKRLAESNGK